MWTRIDARDPSILLPCKIFSKEEGKMKQEFGRDSSVHEMEVDAFPTNQGDTHTRRHTHTCAHMRACVHGHTHTPTSIIPQEAELMEARLIQR